MCVCECVCVREREIDTTNDFEYKFYLEQNFPTKIASN